MPAIPLPTVTPTRSIILLAVASFASQAQVRVTDSLLPQIAADFGTSVGAASLAVTAYALSHGTIQLVIGPVGDRFGKYRTVAITCALSTILVLMCGMAQSLPALVGARLMAGAAAGWVIPISMAYIGDVTPYDQRQPVLGRYLSGQIFGLLFGQAAGGILGDMFGWRNVFFLLGGLFALATAGLIYELATNPRLRQAPIHDHDRPRGFVAEYAAVLSNPWARFVILAVFIEAAFGWGAFAYVGADLHLRFGLSFTLVGLFVAAFGVGGLLYTSSVRFWVRRLGQTGLSTVGGLLVGVAFLALAAGTTWWLAPFAIATIGLGFYMLHNTLQTNATQMTPQARGTAVAIFSSALYLGQTAGVAAGSLVIDRHGAMPVFLAAAAVLPVLGWIFARALRRRPRPPLSQ